MCLKYGGTRFDDPSNKVYYGLDSFYFSILTGATTGKGSDAWYYTTSVHINWLNGPILEDFKDKENFRNTISESKIKVDSWEKSLAGKVAAWKEANKQKEFDRTHNKDGSLDMRLKENRGR